MRIEEFFAYTRERQSIVEKRRLGLPPPWTDNPILRKYRFTCVFREDDKTTRWFRENVRDKLYHRPQEVLLATVLFRWFNRIETGQVIFGQGDMLERGETPWDVFLRTGDTAPMRHALRSAYPRGPYVTGSYMIRSPTGLNKLDGMLHLASEFYNRVKWRSAAASMLSGEWRSVELFTRWLQEVPGQGPFLAYEVACDLIYTPLLQGAPDIMTWANVGPGARRGLNRIFERYKEMPEHRSRKHCWGLPISERQALNEMQILLGKSQDRKLWNGQGAWDMRTVEHNLCEFDKMERVRLGEGVPRQLYSYS